MEEQAQCQFEEGAQKACSGLAKSMRKKMIDVRFTPIVDNGQPAYALYFSVKN